MLEQGVDALGQSRARHGLVLQALARLDEPIQFIGAVSTLTCRGCCALSGHDGRQCVHDVADRVAIAWPHDLDASSAEFTVLGFETLRSKVLDGCGAFILELLSEHREALDAGEAPGLVAGEEVVHQIGECAQGVLQFFGVHASPTIAAVIVLATARTTLANRPSLTRCWSGSSS